MDGTSVPETTVDEHRNLGSGEGDVDGAPGKSGHLVLDAVAHSSGKKRFAECNLGRSVPAGLGDHACPDDVRRRLRRHRTPRRPMW